MFISRVAILITSHNRRELTLASLDSLFRQHRIEDVETEVFLVDDGCTDGRAELLGGEDGHSVVSFEPAKIEEGYSF